jgi:hypothetical protein
VKLVSTCEACQKFSCKTKALAQPGQLIAPSWPLQRWGIDIVNKLTPAQDNYTFTTVEVDYFKKGVEVKPLTNVSSTSIKKFFCQNIICYYGVPRHMTNDNTKYFDNAMFKDFYHQIGTKVAFASVYHPKNNGAVERANGLIFDTIKNPQRQKERKMSGGHDTSSMEP